jgi:hypothetical protein
MQDATKDDRVAEIKLRGEELRKRIKAAEEKHNEWREGREDREAIRESDIAAKKADARWSKIRADRLEKGEDPASKQAALAEKVFGEEKERYKKESADKKERAKVTDELNKLKLGIARDKSHASAREASLYHERLDYRTGDFAADLAEAKGILDEAKSVLSEKPNDSDAKEIVASARKQLYNVLIRAGYQPEDSPDLAGRGQKSVSLSDQLRISKHFKDQKNVLFRDFMFKTKDIGSSFTSEMRSWQLKIKDMDEDELAKEADKIEAELAGGYAFTNSRAFDQLRVQLIGEFIQVLQSEKAIKQQYGSNL